MQGPTKYNKAHFVVMVLQNRTDVPKPGECYMFDDAVKRLARLPLAEVDGQHRLALRAYEAAGGFDD